MYFEFNIDIHAVCICLSTTFQLIKRFEVLFDQLDFVNLYVKLNFIKNELNLYKNRKHL